jgi:DNA-binding response OmpR family regulator
LSGYVPKRELYTVRDEARPDHPEYVVTVRGLGYRFDGEKVK